jgi:hypothetical protein
MSGSQCIRLLSLKSVVVLISLAIFSEGVSAALPLRSRLVLTCKDALAMVMSPFLTKMFSDFILVGEYHDVFDDDIENQNYRERLYDQAAKGEIVLGLEGLIAGDSKISQDWFRSNIPNYSENSSIYGVESEFSYILSGLIKIRLETSAWGRDRLGEDGPSRLNQVFNMIDTTRVGLAAWRLISNGRSLPEYMKFLKSNPDHVEAFLDEIILSFIPLSQSPDFHGDVDEFPNFGSKVQSLLEISSLTARNSDTTWPMRWERERKIREQHYDLIVAWRDLSMTKRIIALYDLARKRRKTAIFIVGGDHLYGLKVQLGQRLKGLPKFVEQTAPRGPFEDRLPREIRKHPPGSI